MNFFVQLWFLMRTSRISKPLATMSLIVLSLIIASSSLPVQANADLDTQEMSSMSAGSSSLSDDAFIEMNVGRTATSRANRIARGGAQVIYVNANATGANNGTSWANAYTGLQNALAAAFDGNEIWVAAGTYKPSSSTVRTASFSMKSGVALYGGFNGSETAREQRDWNANPTILSGDLNGNDNDNVDPNEPTRADNSNHVVMSNGVDSTAVLDGFIISGGNASDDGGGMYNSSNSRVSVNNVTFNNNSASGNGGGMVNFDSSPTISNVTFSNNSAGTSGGGMANGNSSPTISNVTFSGNSASGDGGGMFNYTNSNPIISQSAFRGNEAKSAGGGMANGNSSPTVRNVTFSGNSASGDGGAMFNYTNSNPIISQSAFRGNKADSAGGGMANSNNSSPKISNALFSGNLATLGGGGAMLNIMNSHPTISNVTFSGNRASYGAVMTNDNSSGPTVINSILWNNQDDSGIGTSAPILGGTPTVTYSLVQGGSSGTGNIDANPLFVTPLNPNNAPTTAGDLHLQSNSPAINAGSNSGVSEGAVDLDGNERISGGTVDMGAYEFFGSEPPTPTPIPTEGPQLEETEPNNNCQEADQISTGEVYRGLRSSSSDIDFVGIYVAEQHSTLNLQLSHPTEDYDLEIYYDCIQNGGYIHEIGPGDVGTQETVSFNVGIDSGWYYIAVVGRNGAFDSTTPYTLQADIQPTNTDPVRTVFLVNRSRLNTSYGAERTTQLMVKLHSLANHAKVNGFVMAVDEDPNVAAAYSAWDASLSRTDLANQVTTAIKELLERQHSGFTAMRENGYLVIVGDDRMIPFHRVHVYNYPQRGDPSWKLESQYAHQHLNRNQPSTVGSALFDDQTLTDDFYTDFKPTTRQQLHNLYIPDLATGRLVEKPEEIITLIDTFLAQDGNMNLSTGAVSGYDFVRDIGQDQCDTLTRDGLNMDCSLVTTQFSRNDLIQKMPQPSNDVVALNGHATHYQQIAPDLTAMLSSDISNASGDLSGALFYTIGCQAGLNVPTSELHEFDFPQAFASRGITYIANTGWGYGFKYHIGLTEELMDKFTENIVAGNNTTVGFALVKAKQDYRILAREFDYYDEKVIIQATLFGLPMWEIETPARSSSSSTQNASDEAIQRTLRVSPSTAASPPPSLAEERGWIVDATLPPNVFVMGNEYRFPKAVGNSTNDGKYYTANDLALTDPFEPIQPLFWANVKSSLGEAKGVLMIRGLYGEENGFDPVIGAAGDLNSLQVGEQIPEPEFSSENFYPALPHKLNKISMLGDQREERVIVSIGQYNSQTQTERLFDYMTVDVYYSDSNDETAPTIGTLSQAEQGNQVQVSVPVTDNNGLQRVIATYTTGIRQQENNVNGEWLSVDLTSNGNNTWSGTIPGGECAWYFIQAVDQAGNVAVNHNNGSYFYTCEPDPSDDFTIYLPLVIR